MEQKPRRRPGEAGRGSWVREHGLRGQVSAGQEHLAFTVCRCPRRRMQLSMGFRLSAWDPFSWFSILEHPKELCFMWVMCVGVHHLKH